MKKYAIAFLLVVAACLWWTESVRADEPTYTITVTVNTAAELGCVWNEGVDLTYNAECTDCLQAVCEISTTHDTVGVYAAVDPYMLDTWVYTYTPGTVYTDSMFGGQLIVDWDGYAYQGAHYVTYTVTLLPPTPTPEPSPTPTLDPSEYSEDLDLSLGFHAFLPLMFGGNGSTVNPSDYTGDTTWWEWAQDIEAFFAPVFDEIATTRLDIEELHEGACGTPWTAFTPPLDPTSGNPEFYMLVGNPTATLTAYVMGVSLGRPLAWLRSIQESSSIFGLNFFVMLIYYLAAGIGWIVFVSIITYSARLIRYAVALIIKIYELIPFKAT